MAVIERDPPETEVPLIFPITSRDPLLTKDSVMQNVYVDVADNGQKFVVKRPGLSTYTTFAGGGAVTGQGMWEYKGFLLAAANNALNRIVSPTSTGFGNGGSWQNTFNAPWNGRAQHASVVFNNQIFVIGGFQSTSATFSYMPDVWASPDGKNWTQIVSAAPWGNRAGHRVVVFNGRMYLIGGITTNDNGATVTFMNDVWSSADGVTWQQETGNAGWSARSFPGVVVFNNGIWVIGGFGFNDVWFSTDGSHWSNVLLHTPWNTNKTQFSVVAFNGSMYVIGGSVNGREVWRSSDGLNWTLITGGAFSTGRYGFGCTVYNGLIWVVAGFDGAFLTEVWNSVDGITWNLISAAFGGNARFQCTLEVFISPPGVSGIAATTMYLLGGVDATPVYKNDIWWANLNGTLSTAYTITGAITPYLPMQAVPVNNNQYLAVKDTRGMYVWYQNQITQVIDKNYPTATVPGVVNLDETVYVMTPDALIVGSTIGTPFEWPSRNFIGADYLSDGGVAIAKYSNYLLALGVVSTQLFYNSGAPGSTLLRPLKNANSNVGCVFPYSVVEILGTVLFVGRGESMGRQVFMMDGLAPTPVSNPFIDQFLDIEAINIKAWAATIKGHTYYVLTTTSFTFAFDLKTRMWFRWMTQNSPWFYNNYATDGVNHFYLSDNAAEIEVISAVTFKDLGVTIKVDLISSLITNGTDCWKSCNRFTILMDRVASNSITVMYSDNDYQSWSNPRTLNADQTRISDTRWGRYRQRAWRVQHQLDLPFRARMIIAEVSIGNT